MKSSNDGTGAKTVEAAIVGSSNDGAGATVKSSSESATVEAAGAKAAHGASMEATATTKAAATKSAAPVSTATSASAASTAVCLCTRREQRAGKEGGCQYHHRFSSSHESFLSTGRAISDHRTSRPGPQEVVRLRIANGKVRRQESRHPMALASAQKRMMLINRAGWTNTDRRS